MINVCVIFVSELWPMCKCILFPGAHWKHVIVNKNFICNAFATWSIRYWTIKCPFIVMSQSTILLFFLQITNMALLVPRQWLFLFDRTWSSYQDIKWNILKIIDKTKIKLNRINRIYKILILRISRKHIQIYIAIWIWWTLNNHGPLEI